MGFIMKPLYLIYALAIVAVSAFFSVDPASAQATRTWVSGVGDDVNPCSRTAPCKTFAGAISKTAAGGEIDCLDPGGFGAVTITKSITIDCTGTFGSILHSGTNGVNINDSASGSPGSIKVTLRGLSINGAGTTPGINGINFVSGLSLIVQDCFIQNSNSGGSTSGNGIKVANSIGTVEVFVNNTRMVRNGVPGVSGNGIQIRPTADGAANVFIEDSTISDNDVGVRADGTATTGSINVSIMNTALNGNRVGISGNADASGGLQANVTRSIIAGSVLGLQGVSPAVVRIGDSVVTANTTGLSGNVLTFGNNQMAGNNTLGSPTPVGLQGLP